GAWLSGGVTAPTRRAATSKQNEACAVVPRMGFPLGGIPFLKGAPRKGVSRGEKQGGENGVRRSRPPRLERGRIAVERLSENRVAGRTLLTVCVRRSPEGEGGRTWRGVCAARRSS
ncbi:MAG: hypothetical protein PF904_10005, partial [Kiritimatiellae bacterium]|nr:hypothetical protein [Kiritimatiellia bacterium]